MVATLFNIHADQLFKKAIQDQPYIRKLNGEILNVLRNADDIVIISDSMECLQKWVSK